MLNFLHGIGFGLVTGSILALATVAVSLQFSVTSIPNLAQGEVMMLGAYAAYVTQSMIDNVVLEALAAIAVGALVAWAVYRFVLQSFVRSGTRNTTLLIVTLGVSLVLQNGLLAIFGGSYVPLRLSAGRPLDIGPFIWTWPNIVIMLVALASLTGVHVVLKYTKFGKSQRAVADDPELARVTGIRSARVIQLTWLWAGAMAGLSGFVLGISIGGLVPSLGFQYLLVVFAAAVVGGLGQPYGAMLGALLIGVAMEVSAVYIPADYKQGVALAALILTLLFRPHGLIAARSRIVVGA